MIVIDASALGAVLLPDERSPFTATVSELLQRDDLAAPPHWAAEIANMVWAAARRGRLDADEARIACRAAEEIIASAAVYPFPTTTELVRFATRVDLTVYDASFAYGADSLGCPLVTQDKALIRAAGMLGIELLRP